MSPTSTSVDCIRSRLSHNIDMDIIDSSSSNCISADSTSSIVQAQGECNCLPIMKSKSSSHSLSCSSGQSFEVTMEPLKICLDSDDDSSIESSSSSSSSYDFDDGDSGETAPDQDHEVEHYSLSLAAAYPAIANASSSSSPSSTGYFVNQPLKAAHDSNCTDTLNYQHTAISKSILTTSPPNSAIFVPKRPPSNNNDPPSSPLSSSTHSSFSQLNTSNSSSISNKRPKLKHKQKMKGKRRSVTLHKSVSVIPIPSRCSYSPTVREKIWTSSAELCTNAARNSVEFASEGWDWRKVIEDEHMLLHQASGELIHPIHVQNAFLPISSTSDGGHDFLDAWNLISGLVPNNFMKNNNNATNNSSNNNDSDDVVQQLSSSSSSSSPLQGVSVGPDPVPVSDKV
jgi:hypothetical protein